MLLTIRSDRCHHLVILWVQHINDPLLKALDRFIHLSCKFRSTLNRTGMEPLAELWEFWKIIHFRFKIRMNHHVCRHLRKWFQHCHNHLGTLQRCRGQGGLHTSIENLLPQTPGKQVLECTGPNSQKRWLAFLPSNFVNKSATPRNAQNDTLHYTQTSANTDGWPNHIVHSTHFSFSHTSTAAGVNLHR